MMVDKITLWITPKISMSSIKEYAIVIWLALQHTIAMGIPRLVVSEPCVSGRVTWSAVVVVVTSGADAVGTELEEVEVVAPLVLNGST